MTEQTYNGWTNYATWGVALVLDNDRGTYEYVRERVAEIKDDAELHGNVIAGIWTVAEATRFEVADFLKDYTEELCGLEGDASSPSLMARQVIQAGLADVNWDEIAAHYVVES